jgi:prepilin-type N-terminal cleavage/methylation domain-containing protein
LKNISLKEKYKAFTLLELLIVMSIITILMTMSLSAFVGLRNTVKMNEYILNLEQDIRNVQRSAMLVERDPTENWIYGLGIDFTSVEEDDALGSYTIFKWCSSFPDYGDITTRSKIPGFDPDTMNVDVSLPPMGAEGFKQGICDLSAGIVFPGELYILSGFSQSISPPVSNISFTSDARYVLFESVSGRAFFYDIDGNLLNYNPLTGEPWVDPVSFGIEFTPVGRTSKRGISIGNVSGKIDTHMFE